LTAVQLRSGIQLGYERHNSGGGEVLVLVAGTGSDHRFWHLQAPAYSEAFDVIAVDLRGAGAATVTPEAESYTCELLARDLRELLDHLGVDRAHFSGHSLGSAMLQEYALLDPGRVASLQLHATWGRADEWLKRAFIGTCQYPLARGDLRMTLRTVLMWMLSPEYLETRSPAAITEMIERCYIANPDLDKTGNGMLGHLHADAVHDTLARLGEITAPTLVTAGEQDYLIPARYGQAVAELIPNAEYHLFTGPGSSHGMNWEMRDIFNAVTLDFLERQSAAIG
jgi:pimeloyl-ACP methyl ester carboxylesterase